MKQYIRLAKEIPLGTKVYIKSPGSWADGEWGIVNYYDGEFYHVGIAGGEPDLIFDRKELKVAK